MRLRPVAVVALVALAAPASASAQLTLTGRVTDDTQRPLAGANVFIEGTTVGTFTNDDGTYRFVVPNPRPAQVLVARFIGHKPQRDTIPEQSGIVTRDFRLTRDVLQLSEVVTTGTRVETERAQLGATLATVEGEAIADAGATQVDAALAGKVPGALVLQNSGTPGGGTSVRMRGLSTISRSAEPLYIVDGVIIDNSSNALIDLGGHSSNRLADLDPDDIERVEVVKGAAAAALYGSRANDGVVQIFTKRGRSGAMRVTFRNSLGWQEAEHLLEVNRAPVNAAGQPVTRYDYQQDIFRTAQTYSSSLQLSGGDDKTQYFLSGSLDSEDGIVRSTDYRRQNIRLNLDRVVTDWLKLAVSTNYVHSKANALPQGGLTSSFGVLTNFLFTSNDRRLYPDSITGDFPKGQLFSNPLEVIANWKSPQTVDRWIGGLQLTATPIENLKLDYRLGYDQYTQASELYVPRNSSAPALATGVAHAVSNRTRLINSDFDASYTAQPSPRLRLTTSAGMNWQEQDVNVVSSRATDIPLLTNVVQGSNQFVSQGLDERRTLGFYVQEQAGIGDALFLTAAIRSDASSAFGPDERTQYFPKFGGSLDLSQVDAWQRSAGTWIDRLRLRAAYGFSGGQPTGSFDRLSNYVLELGGGRAGLVNATVLGNEALAPERQKELELGFDLEVLQSRVGLELTYFDKTVEDLILPQSVRPSSGFLSRLANVGELQNSGIELLLRTLNVRRADFTWGTTVTYTTNDPKVTKLSDGGAFFIPESFNIIRVEEGMAPGHFFGTTYVRDANGNILDAAGNPIVDASGDVVGIPAIGTRKIIGDPNPDAFWSVSNDFTVGQNLSFRVQFDAVTGFDAFNFDRRLLETPAFGAGREYERELTGEVPKGYFAARRSIFEEYIEDGSFVKLRELSLTYTLPASLAGRLSARSASLQLIGRNLKTWTDYTGWDPEANTGAQRTLVRGFGFATVPIPRSYSLGLTLNF